MKNTKSSFADPHFWVAVVILLVSAVGWRVAVAQLKLNLRHEAVPWPEHVSVSSSSDDSFRNLTFPKVLGPYSRVEADGLLNYTAKGQPEKDGQPDGEIIQKSDMLEVMGMGTSMDKGNIASRQSNWYLSRVYEDSREPMNSPYRFWQLTLTYYTGGLDTVPHIAETCWQAGGMSIVSCGQMGIQSPSGVPEPWAGTLKWQRVIAESRDLKQYMGYYIFSLNGKPEDSRERVRLGLMDLFVKHSYFAKIEVVPRGSTFNAEESDQKARELVQASLPAILRDFPMPSDIQKLESSSR